MTLCQHQVIKRTSRGERGRRRRRPGGRTRA